jgi:hypothetical protein
VRSRNDDALSAALWAASETSRPRDDCPDAERTWRAVAEELPLDERLAIVDHTVVCPACAEVWRLAMELGARARTKVAERPSNISRLRASGALELASAAVVVFAIGVLFAVQWFRTPADPVVRDPGLAVLQSDQHRQRAEALLASGDTAGALAAYRAAVEETPGRCDAARRHRRHPGRRRGPRRRRARLP